ncbi:membrane protein DedA with SNARE-associated domain [Sphingomonas sp. SORGH_AS802]|uniref:DedA family protein n=1 Tax=unclassified Sphingomonas TaxID=196159 RepID=UPI002855DD93|nr:MULTISPECIES: DedA family protein [unclassified Sphingomonas]MDR6127706.1 membrane protein DedA with SNARE-associated domain [Sphingomonas sp. SORGH_AS_0438]MDR6133381.1 membrane protein DedA with SNARE-associated domain [Sphingomonas sp. SORGH_AS_0802]
MTDFILEWIARGGYLGIVALMALENIFPPIPSEVIMGLGGMAVARGQMQLGWLLLAGTVGSVIGNYFWYALGRKFGYRGLKPFVDRWGRWLTVDWQDVEAITRFFHDRGGWVIFVFRFMPSFRTIISLPAGMAKMPRWRFLVATSAGTTIWNIILAGAGILLDRNFEQLDRYVGPLAIATMVAVLGYYLYRVVTWKPREE